MSKRISQNTIILNADAADVAENDAVYHSIEGWDEVLFSVDITGTVTVTLDFDINGDGTVIVQEAFTSDSQKILDDPSGRVKAWCSGCGAEEAAVVYMRKKYFRLHGFN